MSSLEREEYRSNEQLAQRCVDLRSQLAICKQELELAKALAESADKRVEQASEFNYIREMSDKDDRDTYHALRDLFDKIDFLIGYWPQSALRLWWRRARVLNDPGIIEAYYKAEKWRRGTISREKGNAYEQ